MEKISVYFATSNQGKLRELIDIFQTTFGSDYSLIGRAARDCEETALTFQGNADLKAEALAAELSQEKKASEITWVIADDSGLCVDCLGGAPGIYSARYAGDHVDASAHMKKLLSEIAGTQAPQPWKAHYHCALTLLVLKNNRVEKRYTGEGQVFGEIVPDARGQSGFGYDPIFLFPDIGLRFSEVPDRDKNGKSHRMAAFKELKKDMGETIR